MMRISPVGYMFDSEEVIKNSKLATIPSHNSEDSIRSSETVALIIYYARKGYPKEEIINKLKIKLRYKAFEKFNSTACIVGSMAEAMFGINSELINKAKCKLPKEFIDVLEKAYKNKKIEDYDFVK